MAQLPTIVIGGVSSGVGKTTVAAGLMAALARRGLRVQPFKVGPDYIDPSYHVAATGVPSRNLDGWMVPRANLLELFHRACRSADIALVEGVMGVFDGYNGRDEAGSSAQIAKLLDAPVLLLMDAGKMARSAGAMALGYARFDPAMRVGGFLLNQIAGESHYRMVQEAIEETGVGPVLGYLPRDLSLTQPERHLGLVPTPERSLPEGFLDRLVELVENHFDLDRIIAIARSAGASAALPEAASLFPASPLPQRTVIAFAQDEAFNFYYQDNLDLLEAHNQYSARRCDVWSSVGVARYDVLHHRGRSSIPDLYAILGDIVDWPLSGDGVVPNIGLHAGTIRDYSTLLVIGDRVARDFARRRTAPECTV
ncbi:MAG TPA: cobyrinate a,c-diamide synthase, partial [Chloroflexota bacterium]|nr:cobyrinate a,c-diamide synthase [Chloroflexota bacterium]